MKVAINKCYGGFSPSDALYGILIAKGWDVTTYDDDWSLRNPDAKLIDNGERKPLISRYSFVTA
ncbi:hypothetical protein [Paenibacillus alvei]|uniref:hypothetical protein n=1 Tax=Paenibacillus alvei TaxID=44250 RepID=UPI0018CE740F|nr:hypothetical protein [Paenibacillus alvei]MBG9736694.1 hypothetical protein [Paenibacillus alvei]MBG9745835.1 hypothetical protein [Paenibacillus alvei]MCY9580516.1 hypothetical protein [Paenibacillus alvei]MCY9583159.1 hypothetical protein [Paenibacillus alvei]